MSEYLFCCSRLKHDRQQRSLTVTSNSLTVNALAGKSITSNALAGNSLSSNALAGNSITSNALAGNGLTSSNKMSVASCACNGGPGVSNLQSSNNTNNTNSEMLVLFKYMVECAFRPNQTLLVGEMGLVNGSLGLAPEVGTSGS